MFKDDLFRKKAWLDSYNEKVNEKLDEFYSMVPDSGLSDREQYLYDTAQNQFKMLYELLDNSRELINAELMFIENASKTRANAGTQI